MKKTKNKPATQLVGNVGLYYVCYKLSCLGWNVLPTSRNAKGVDVVIYNQDATKTLTIPENSCSSPGEPSRIASEQPKRLMFAAGLNVCAPTDCTCSHSQISKTKEPKQIGAQKESEVKGAERGAHN